MHNVCRIEIDKQTKMLIRNLQISKELFLMYSFKFVHSFQFYYNLIFYQ